MLETELWNDQGNLTAALVCLWCTVAMLDTEQDSSIHAVVQARQHHLGTLHACCSVLVAELQVVLGRDAG